MTSQQLKNSILQMAVQGLLVPQDPNDEPASVLLQRIREEKQKLVKEGKIKKDKHSSVIFRGSDNLPYKSRDNSNPVCIAEQLPFDIPETWEWARLGDVSIYIQRGKSPKYSNTAQYPVISQKCIQWTGFSIDKARFIVPETLNNYAEERFLVENDLLWNSTGLGTLGRIAVYRENKNPYSKAVADGHVTVIRLSSKFSPLFLYYFIANPTVQSVIEEQADGTTKQKELALSTVQNFLIPIPPLEEQRRIVAKIEELLPLVEEYGKAESTLTTLNATFPEALKKSILQDAVQGKLVPQDPDEEPASVLLERIRREKNALEKGKKGKRNSVDSRIVRRDNSYYELRDGVERCIDEFLPFDIPESWEWARLGDVGILSTGNTPSRQHLDYFGSDLPFVTPGDIQDGKMLHPKQGLSSLGKSFGRIVPQNSILQVCIGGSIGKSCITNYSETAFNQQINAITVIKSSFKYIYQVLSAPYFQRQLNIAAGGTATPIINKKDWANIFIPIPPLAEQRRIVAKIEELLKQVETLK